MHPLIRQTTRAFGCKEQSRKNLLERESEVCLTFEQHHLVYHCYQLIAAGLTCMALKSERNAVCPHREMIHFTVSELESGVNSFAQREHPDKILKSTAESQNTTNAVTSHFCEHSFIHLKSSKWVFICYPYYIVHSVCERHLGHPLKGTTALLGLRQFKELVALQLYSP